MSSSPTCASIVTSVLDNLFSRSCWEASCLFLLFAITLLFSSIISSSFYPKLLNKINNAEKDIEKYIFKIQKYMKYLSAFFCSFAIPVLFFFNKFLNVQYIDNIYFHPIFILCAIPHGLINIYICVVISFNNEKKIFKNLILLLVIQLIFQITIYHFFPLIFSALFYVVYSIFYYKYIKNFALKNINLTDKLNI